MKISFILIYCMALLKPFAINAVVWNPLSANTEERLLDIIEETCNFDIIILPGTCVRAPKTGDTKILQHNKTTCIAAGYGASKSVNQACGCSIIIGKSFAKHVFGNQLFLLSIYGEGDLLNVFLRKGLSSTSSAHIFLHLQNAKQIGVDTSTRAETLQSGLHLC